MINREVVASVAAAVALSARRAQVIVGRRLKIRGRRRPTTQPKWPARVKLPTPRRSTSFFSRGAIARRFASNPSNRAKFC